uniref:Transposase IS66 n=1 Tax=uncultured bacterium Contigcl_1748 TaxID=1393656 RepID=W0FSI7_9BACT|nr:transposase IS66 [uncultured bacterium Contigcl_1748]
MNENDILRQAIEALQASVASLSENHRKEVDALQSKIKEQEAQIAWLKQQLFGSKSEKRPVFDPNLPRPLRPQSSPTFSARPGRSVTRPRSSCPGKTSPPRGKSARCGA